MNLEDIWHAARLITFEVAHMDAAGKDCDFTLALEVNLSNTGGRKNSGQYRF